MKIVNINSSIPFPEEAIKMCYSRDDFSQIIAARCPVFLVDSSLMDYVYYPWKLRSYNNGCLRKKLDTAIDKIANLTNGKDNNENLNSLIFETLDSFWNQMEECRDNTKTVSEYIPATGLFVREINKDILEKIQKESTTNIENYIGADVIILCPERIEKWSNEMGVTLFR